MAKPPPGLLRLSYLFVEVVDLPRMQRFYHEQLGLPIEFEQAGVCVFLRPAGGGPRIALYAGRESPVGAADHLLVAFDVADIETEVERIRARGIHTGDVKAVPGGRAARFEDPEGNRLELHEPDA